MRRLIPIPTADDLDVEALAAHYAYPAQPSMRPDDPNGFTVRANMVSSVDGAITLDGKSKPISGTADWYLYGLQRALADVIVVGAGTARAEGYGPGRARAEFSHLREAAGQPPAPTLALVTRRGDIDPNADYLGGSTRADRHHLRGRTPQPRRRGRTRRHRHRRRRRGRPLVRPRSGRAPRSPTSLDRRRPTPAGQPARRVSCSMSWSRPSHPSSSAETQDA